MSGAACRNPKLAQAGAKKHGIIPKPGTFSVKQRQAFQQLQNSRSMGRRHGCGMHDSRGKAFEKGGKPLGEQQERTEQPKRFAECSQDDVRRTRHPGAQPAPSGAERAHRMGLIHHQEKTILAAEFSHTGHIEFRTVHTEQGLRHHQRLYRGGRGGNEPPFQMPIIRMGICPHIGFPQYEPSGDAGMYPAIHKDGLSSMDQRHRASEVALIAARQEQAFVKPEIRRNRLLRFFGDPAPSAGQT